MKGQLRAEHINLYLIRFQYDKIRTYHKKSRWILLLLLGLSDDMNQVEMFTSVDHNYWDVVT